MTLPQSTDGYVKFRPPSPLFSCLSLPPSLLVFTGYLTHPTRSRLYIQGIDKNGVVYWEPRISDGEEEKRFEYFEWIPVRSVADIPAGAWNGKGEGK